MGGTNWVLLIIVAGRPGRQLPTIFFKLPLDLPIVLKETYSEAHNDANKMETNARPKIGFVVLANDGEQSAVQFSDDEGLLGRVGGCDCWLLSSWTHTLVGSRDAFLGDQVSIRNDVFGWKKIEFSEDIVDPVEAGSETGHDCSLRVVEERTVDKFSGQAHTFIHFQTWCTPRAHEWPDWNGNMSKPLFPSILK